MKKLWLALGLVVIVFAAFAGRILVVDSPSKADAIVVLDGGRNDNRYYQGLEMLRAGFAPRMYLDALSDNRRYGHPDADYAQKFIQESAGPEANRVNVCPIQGDSTVAETAYVAKCLQSSGARSVLVVTSNFHTRRARAIFRKMLPEYRVFVASAPDDQFGVNWWRHREWAKTTLQEWQKLIFWELVDRWRLKAH
ncbi:MAG TPA: YdcF family protein [Terriglobales bacterium]|nr:YdcF family protein [Terriglobales bacterium]